jgi:hypothetical protein
MPSAFVIIFGQIFAALPDLLPLDLSRPFCQIFTSIYRKERQSLFSLSLMPVSYNGVALCRPTKRGARTLSKKRGEWNFSHLVDNFLWRGYALIIFASNKFSRASKLDLVKCFVL